MRSWRRRAQRGRAYSAGEGLVLEGMGHVDSGIEGLVGCEAAAEATLADE
jgi:hypothetical protein